MSDSAFDPSTEDVAVFRPRLAPLAMPAIMLTLVLYFVFIYAADADTSMLARYPFGCAALIGLGLFVFRVLTRYRATGIRVDARGVTANGTSAASFSRRTSRATSYTSSRCLRPCTD